MKRFLRFISVSVFLFFGWPFFLYRKYGNVNYKPESKTVIACNHYSTFDAFFIYLAYRKYKIRFVTIAETKKKLLSRYVTWLFDCLFIESQGVNLKFFKSCLDVLKGGGIICIFPEGVINPSKFGFFDFKNSFVYFARKTGAKILPLYLYPELSAFKRSKLYIGDIVYPEDIAVYETLDEANAYVLSKIMEYSTLI